MADLSVFVKCCWSCLVCLLVVRAGPIPEEASRPSYLVRTMARGAGLLLCTQRKGLPIRLLLIGEEVANRGYIVASGQDAKLYDFACSGGCLVFSRGLPPVSIAHPNNATIWWGAHAHRVMCVTCVPLDPIYGCVGITVLCRAGTRRDC